MVKAIALSCLSILILWVGCDLVLHNYLLAPLYAQDAHLWRPLAAMNVPLVFAVRLLLVGLFVASYVVLVRPRSLRAGLLYGLFTGLTLGVAVGFGSYIHSPIPLSLAWGWFFAACLKSLLAGAMTGWLIPRR